MTFKLEPSSLSDRAELSKVNTLANLDNAYGEVIWKGRSTEERIAGNYARLPSKMLAEGSWMVKLLEGDCIIASAEWSLPEPLWERLRAEHPLNVTEEERQQYRKDFDDSVVLTDGDWWPKGMRLDVAQSVVPLLREGNRKFPQGRQYIVPDELKTLPVHRPRGAGSMLLQHGIVLADREGLEICLRATPQGMRFYERYGFERVHKVSPDLESYGDEPAFVWIFMVRQPSIVGFENTTA